MRNKYTMDELLRQSLTSAQPSEQLNRNLKASMEAKAASGKAGSIMKFRKKKTFFIAAAACAVLSVTAVATTGIVSYVTGYSTNDEYSSFSQLEEAEQKSGLDIRATEQFANGYTFDQMSIPHWTTHDESGAALSSFCGIDIEYGKDGEPLITLCTEPTDGSSSERDDTAAETKTISGIEVQYYNDTYKFVPTGYEMTEEDLENLKRDDYFISEGSDEIEETMISSVIWEQDGVTYTLMCETPDGCPSQMLFDMAAELIEMT